MTEAEERKAYLEQLIIQALTINVNEAEGQQVINLDDINICDVDGNPIEEPYLTKDEVDTIMHFNDPNVIHKNMTANPSTGTGTGTGTDGDGTGSSTANPTVNLIDNNPSTDTTELPGTDSAGITSDMAGTTDSSTADTTEGNDYNFKMTGLTDEMDLDEIVNAIVNDGNSSGQLHAVVEFATPSITDSEGVDYQLYIKPGQSLTADTIIGTVKMKGTTKPIKSIFDSGTVMANDSGTDFKHLYAGAGANRHFIIEDYTLCGEATDVNTDLIDEIKGKFEKEAQLHQLITDNLCECILPWVLLRRYHEYEYIFRWVRNERPNGREIFGEYLDYVQAIKEEYSNDIQTMGTADNIKATNGNIKKMNDLGDSIIARRKKYADDIIDTFQNYRQTLDLSEYDPDYSDCKYLAFDHGIDYGQQETGGTIGNIDYNNYYMALLAQIDISSNNSYAQQYYDLISEIVEIRITKEVYKIENIASEFNSLFHDIVNKGYRKPYDKLYTAMKELDTVEYANVVDWITDKQNSGQYNEYTTYGIRQLANIFLFCWNYEAYTVPEENEVQAVTKYVSRSYPVYTEFYWVEGAEFPQDDWVDPKTFAEVPNGTYSVGSENGEYAVNLSGLTGWLREKNDTEVILYIPELTTEEWEQVEENYMTQTNTIYDLVKQEWIKISGFWEDALAEYYNCQLSDAINELTEVANSVEKYASWPLPSPLSIGYDTYEHYLFQNTDTGADNSSGDEDYECGIDYETTAPEIPTEMEAPEATLDDLLENDDDVQDGEPTIKDFKYWQRYFALSTVISLPYLNCGLDILPFVQLIPLPCIFTCIGVIYIQVLDIVMVFGIAIRGMYIWPIVLFVNLSDQYANIMTALVAQLKNILAQINAKINSLMEAPITSLANGYINMLEADNQDLRNQNKLLETYISSIKSQKTTNAYKIKKNINKIFNPTAKQTQQVIDPLNASENQ